MPTVERLLRPIRARPDWWAIAFLLVVSLLIRVPYLSRPFHGDEMITFSNMVLGRDLTGIVFGPFDGNSHLLNSLIMKAVYLCFGENTALMRLPNLVFVLLAVVFLYVVCSREFGRITGFAAAFLLSLHPAIVLFSVFGRGYAGMILFTLLSSFGFLQLTRSFSWWRLCGCALTGFLAGASHLFAVNVLMAQALLLIITVLIPEKNHLASFSARAAHAGKLALGPLSALVLLVAVYLPQIRLNQSESFAYVFQASFPVALVNYMGGIAYRTDLDVFSMVILAPALVGMIFLNKIRPLRNYLAILFLSPFALYGLSYLAPVFTLHPRFFVYLLPFYCLLIVAGLIQASRTIRAKRGDLGYAPTLVRGVASVCFLIIALTFVDRTKVPRGGAFVRAQRVVGEFIDAHPDALFLTNDTGFVRVRLRQEENMDRIRSALGIKPIREFQAEQPTGEIFFIYVPRKRFTEADLIHYQGNVAPEVHYERDDRMRAFLTKNAAVEVDLPPRVQIYKLRP